MSFQYVRSGSPVPSVSSSAASSSSSRRSGTSEQSSSSSSNNRSGPSPLSLVPSVIPDLRFEQSYLASIRPFIHELTHEEAEQQKQRVLGEKRGSGTEPRHGGDGDGDDDDDATPWIVTGEKGEALGEKQGGSSVTKAKRPSWHHGEPELWIGRLRIDWVPLLTVTLRDQVFSPLVQGAFWAVVGLFLGQARDVTRAYLGVQAGLAASWFRSSFRSQQASGSTSSMPGAYGGPRAGYPAAASVGVSPQGAWQAKRAEL